MTLDEFEAALQDPAPVYVVAGTDDFVRRRAFELTEARVPADSRAFNWSLFDLVQHSEEEVVAAAQTLPWMADRRWLWVKNAHQGGQRLTDYLRDPAPHAVVILEADKKVRGWPRIPSLAARAGRGDDLGRFVAEWCGRAECRIEPAAVRLLLENCGANRQRIENELEKLVLWDPDNSFITVEAVAHLTAGAQGPEVFDLIRAIAGGRQDTALRLLHRLYETGTHPQQLLALLHWNLRRLLVAREQMERGRRFADIVAELKIWSYKGRERVVRGFSRRFLVAALRELRKTDRLGKSTDIDLRIQLDALVFRLLR